ncbi:MAG: S16 family serine protease [Candidatus Anstonellaceae archaeon]
MKKLLLLLLLAAAAFACNEAQRKIYVAAVTGESSGGIFQLEVELKPGKGLIYTAVVPRTGYTTQESELAAVQYAFASAGADLQQCDVFFTMKGDFGQNTVDGPSAGAAMALAVKAALLNKSIRQDVAVTGTIHPSGKIGEVGGVIEKAIAAAEFNLRYFVVPKLKFYEAFLISSLSKKYSFAAIEAETIQEAEKVVFSDYSQVFSPNFSPESKPAPSNLPLLSLDSDTARFSLVAKKVVDRLEASIALAKLQDPALSSYFSAEISKYRKLLSQGYLFTAANSAFLLSIDAEYAKLGDKQVDINRSFDATNQCILQISQPQKSRQNIHWAAASDLRRTWAQKKLNETVQSRTGWGGYMLLRDLFFAQNWCMVSSELSAEAKEIGGEPIDEGVLAELAQQKLSEAESLFSSSERQDYDALWHYEAGLLANKSGDFAAAIYDATYAITMQKLSMEAKQNLSQAAKQLASTTRSSLWGKIYFAQGLYLYYDALENNLPLADAYKILKYSEELDKAAAEIDRVIEEKAVALKQPTLAKQPSAVENDDALVAAAFGSSLAAVALIALLRIVRVVK